MRILVKLSIAVIALFFASCHNEVQELPSPGEVKYCVYYDKDQVLKCKDTFFEKISDENCSLIGGTLSSENPCK